MVRPVNHNAIQHPVAYLPAETELQSSAYIISFPAYNALHSGLSLEEVDMLKSPKRTKSQQNVPSHDELRSNIRSQTEDFIRLGGVIQSIPNGVSGQIWKPSGNPKTSKT